MEKEVRSDLMTVASMCDPVEVKPIVESMLCIDDVSGEPLDPILIRKARQEEMRGFDTKEVPKVRSRLVRQQLAHGERRDGLYAPTPPLAAARFLLSTCASQVKRGPGDYRILLLDIKKAFLYGKISRNVYIELPAEDPMSEGGGGT